MTAKGETLNPPVATGDRPATAYSAHVVALREELRGKAMRRIARFDLGDLDVEICRGGDSIWAIVRRDGAGGVALRAAYAPTGGFATRRVDPEGTEVLRIEATSVLGRHVIAFHRTDADLHRLRMQVWLTPDLPLLIPFHPRDLYPIDAQDDPTGAEGVVEAAQRGVNSGIVYLRMTEPAFGSVLYFQNLTALNPYFLATGTVPDTAVGGEWPELGFLPPTPPQSGTPPIKPLPAGEQIAMSDVSLVVRDHAQDDELAVARQFLQMLGTAYKALSLPATEYRDWVGRSERTLRDLDTAPVATVTHYGHRYVMPYPEGEYPDVMVQMTTLAAIHDYGAWRGMPHPLEPALADGMGRFYHRGLGTLRRYLPNVGSDKDPNAVDSWYLYHPMLNLARLAQDGDDAAKRLLLKSVGFGIRAARHFDYAWPVQYDQRDFTVLTRARNDERYGQTDVGGIYASLMLALYALTDDPTYLEEARKAIDAAIGMRFNLEYQANLTAWGAAACMRLWRITGEDRYREQGYVYLASFFHNTEIWDSRIGHAVHYPNFLGATCLHDAPYMAIFECFDSFMAFERYLTDSGPDLDSAVRMLVSEYCKYALDRAWFYYPDALPAGIIATGEHQSGVIYPDLSFPLEDLYGDGQSPGQVGQEIYGSGAAMVFATRSHHRIDGAPFLLYCNHFIRAMERTGDNALSIQLDGGETCEAVVALVRQKRRKLTPARLTTAGGDAVRPHATTDDRIDFRVPASGRLILTWE